MGQQFTVDRDDDVVESAIVQTTKVLTGIGSGFAQPAGGITITVGTNLYTSANRHKVDRAIQQITDVLREVQWPNGAAASDFGYLLTLPATKGEVVQGTIAAFADDTFTEDSIAISYNAFAGTGAGSSTNYQSAVTKIRDSIRSSLTDG